MQNPAAADVSPRHLLEFAPTHVRGCGVLNERHLARIEGVYYEMIEVNEPKVNLP